MPSAAASLDRIERHDEVRELQARIQAMQATKLDSKALDTSPTAPT